MGKNTLVAFLAEGGYFQAPTVVCAAYTSRPAWSSWEGWGDKQEPEGPLSIVLKHATCKSDAKYHANTACINLEPTALGILGNKMSALYVIIFTAPIFLF